MSHAEASTPVPPENARGERVLLWLGLAGLLMAGGVTTWAVLQKRKIDQVEAAALEASLRRQLVDFSLTDQSGRTVTRADLAGCHLVVSFVFTSCSVSCLAVSRQMSRVQEMTANRPEVALVSLTVDPRTDTPPVLAEFGRKFAANPERWRFLTGEPARVDELIATSFLDRAPEPPDELMPGGFRHTERIAVMNPAGRLVGFVNGLRTTAAEEVLQLLPPATK